MNKIKIAIHINELKIRETKKKSLVKYYSERIMAIPELQRNFVWNANRMRDLADSIFKGYSIGSFTIWDAPRKKETHFKHSKGVIPPYESKNNKRIHYVVDGQQRLSVLYAFLAKEGKDITTDSGITLNSRNVCFSIKKNEDGLNFSYVKKGPDNKRYFSLCDILSENYKERFYFLRRKQSKKFKRIESCRRKFLDYPFFFLYLEGNITDDILRETFIRLNTRGLSLSAVDRNYAYASKVHLREYVGRIKERLGVLKTINDKPIHELIYMIFKTEDKSSRFNSQAIGKIFQKINNDSKYKSKFESEWKLIAKGLARAENFLKCSCGVKSLQFIPSLTMVSVLSLFYYYYKKDKLSPYIEKQLKKWFWYSSISGRYSGKGYYYYAPRDTKTMKSLAEGKRREFEGFNKKVDPEDIDGSLYYSNKSSLVRAFYCLLALQNPREFFNGKIAIPLDHPTYRERKENHHIFPEALIKNIVPEKKYNNIVNICFLPKHTNASFSKDPPYDYLDSKDIDKSRLGYILESHLIPKKVRKKPKNKKARANLINELFREFYSDRKQIIIKMFERESGIKIFQ